MAANIYISLIFTAQKCRCLSGDYINIAKETQSLTPHNHTERFWKYEIASTSTLNPTLKLCLRWWRNGANDLVGGVTDDKMSHHTWALLAAGVPLTVALVGKFNQLAWQRHPVKIGLRLNLDVRKDVKAP